MLEKTSFILCLSATTKIKMSVYTEDLSLCVHEKGLQVDYCTVLGYGLNLKSKTDWKTLNCMMQPLNCFHWLKYGFGIYTFMYQL